MIRREIMTDFLKKAVLPIVIALLLFSIFSRIFTENGARDYFLIWLAYRAIARQHAVNI